MSTTSPKFDIICTLGPGSSTADVLQEMVQAGMTVARINCSHYDPALSRKLIAWLRQFAPQVRILLDLQGPRLRVASRYPEKTAREGQIVQFVGEIEFVSARRKDAIVIPLALYHPFAVLEKVTTVYMKDGSMAFDVLDNRARDGFILTKTRWGGAVRGEKSINIPGLPPPPSALTDKDRADLAYAAEMEVDAVMLSFVNQVKDIEQLEAAWESLRTPKKKPLWWAKIETAEGIRNLPSICEKVSAILIGRGDLAVDVGLLDAPAAQSQILEVAGQAKIPCYVATQVLESMRSNPFPSRSELRDVYASLREGASGFMLTAETSVGRYPGPAIKVLQQMIEKHQTAAPTQASPAPARRKAKGPTKKEGPDPD